ncbi:MAG: hypothetical protein RDU25_01695 [Patescibacteria group bacterium]|nr:hypothetical protein [Patescibacteria group bacterium]
MGWTKFYGSKVHGSTIHGTLAKGDKTMPPTRWWNHLFLLWFKWDKVTVFEVASLNREEKQVAPYRVGYKPQVGPAMLRDDLMTSRRFAVLNGNEDCVFFAVDENGNEVALLEIEQVSKDSLPASIPLI